MLVLTHSFYLSSQNRVDPATESTYKLLDSKFNYDSGITYGQVHPFTDNMLVFAVYKGLALFFGAIEHAVNPETSPSFGRLMPIDQNQLFIMLALKGFALFLQCCLVHAPIAFLVESVYKKNSNTFKTLLVAITLTAISLYTLLAVEIDYQAILFIGCMLWSQVFLLNDNVPVSMFFYGLALNSSLDGLLVLPFIMYRVCCKSIKKIYKDQARGRPYSDLHRDNFLDVNMLLLLFSSLQVDLLAFAGGYFITWAPYFMYGFNPTKLAKKVNKAKPTSVLFDPVDSSLYRPSVLNAHCLWNVAFAGAHEKYLEELHVPAMLHLAWIFMTNLVVILYSRLNKQLTSHKKSLLQLLLCLQVNFLVGNPKM